MYVITNVFYFTNGSQICSAYTGSDDNYLVVFYKTHKHFWRISRHLEENIIEKLMWITPRNIPFFQTHSQIDMVSSRNITVRWVGTQDLLVPISGDHHSNNSDNIGGTFNSCFGYLANLFNSRRRHRRRRLPNNDLWANNGAGPGTMSRIFNPQRHLLLLLLFSHSFIQPY